MGPYPVTAALAAALAGTDWRPVLQQAGGAADAGEALQLLMDRGVAAERCASFFALDEAAVLPAAGVVAAAAAALAILGRPLTVPSVLALAIRAGLTLPPSPSRAAADQEWDRGRPFVGDLLEVLDDPDRAALGGEVAPEVLRMMRACGAFAGVVDDWLEQTRWRWDAMDEVDHVALALAALGRDVRDDSVFGLVSDIFARGVVGGQDDSAGGEGETADRGEDACPADLRYRAAAARVAQEADRPYYILIPASPWGGRRTVSGPLTMPEARSRMDDLLPLYLPACPPKLLVAIEDYATPDAEEASD